MSGLAADKQILSAFGLQCRGQNGVRTRRGGCRGWGLGLVFLVMKHGDQPSAGGCRLPLLCASPPPAPHWALVSEMWKHTLLPQPYPPEKQVLLD